MAVVTEIHAVRKESQSTQGSLEMARLKRLAPVPFGWYYIALHAECKRNLVKSAADVNMFLEVARATLRKKGAELHAIYVAKNEVHLAIRSGGAPVSEITRNLCHEYARRFNREHHESGGLFRSHAHVLLIQQGRWLVPLVHFIHWIPRLRPLQSGHSDCSWNSDAAYRGHARRRGLVTHSVLRILSGGVRRREVQEQAYRECFDEAPNPENVWLFAHGSPEDRRMLGDEEFREATRNFTHQEPPRREPAAASSDAVRHAIINLVQRFCSMCDKELPVRQARRWKRTVTLEQLCSRSRKRPLPMIRAVAASYIINRKLGTRAKAASFFGCRPETLSAHRRRHYVTLFRECFGSAAVMEFCSELKIQSDHPFGGV
jgi:REP element-mobilizing transposase RayT